MGFDLGAGRLLCSEETIDQTAHRQRWAGLAVRKQCLLYRKSEEQRWKGKEGNGKQAVEELWSAGLEMGSLVMGVMIDDGTNSSWCSWGGLSNTNRKMTWCWSFYLLRLICNISEGGWAASLQRFGFWARYSFSNFKLFTKLIYGKDRSPGFRLVFFYLGW